MTDKKLPKLTVLNSSAVNKTISPQLPQNKTKKTFHLRVDNILFEISVTFLELLITVERIRATKITKKIIARMKNDCQKLTRKLGE